MTRASIPIKDLEQIQNLLISYKKVIRDLLDDFNEVRELSNDKHDKIYISYIQTIDTLTTKIAELDRYL